ncbi:gonadal somatic cell derived factor [Mobula hypostoma]|uniref:gonadal somatic cell derived factor n=1 Tax=Mobula hypostoma TaxID=723540 RepID=UPI002FC2B067
MWPLSISLLLALSLAHLRMSHFLPVSEWQPGRAPASRGNERAVQHIKHILLRALNLEQIPRIHTEMAKQLRSMWRARLQATSHISAITASSPPAGNGTQFQNEETVAGTNMSTMPSSPRHCCQMASQITLTDLGWQDWILYPEQITYVHCASCRHPRNALAHNCHRNKSSSSSRSHRRHCCKAVKTIWVPIVYVDEDLSLVISNIPLTEECGEEH